VETLEKGLDTSFPSIGPLLCRSSVEIQDFKDESVIREHDGSLEQTDLSSFWAQYWNCSGYFSGGKLAVVYTRCGILASNEGMSSILSRDITKPNGTGPETSPNHGARFVPNIFPQALRMSEVYWARSISPTCRSHSSLSLCGSYLS
jgi:hypothetical protein